MRMLWWMTYTMQAKPIFLNMHMVLLCFVCIFFSFFGGGWGGDGLCAVRSFGMLD